MFFNPYFTLPSFFYFFEKGGQDFRKFIQKDFEFKPWPFAFVALSFDCTIALQQNFNHMRIPSLDQLQHSPATSTVELSCNGVENKQTS